MSTRDLIPDRLVEILSATDLPAPVINEPEPARWLDGVGTDPIYQGVLDDQAFTHALFIQDEGAPAALAFVRGAPADPTEELELTVIVAYAVVAKPGVGSTMDTLRSARRMLRKEAVRIVKQAILADPTLGLGPEVYAEIEPPAYADDVPLTNALACATALLPVRILYTAADAAS